MKFTPTKFTLDQQQTIFTENKWLNEFIFCFQCLIGTNAQDGDILASLKCTEH